MAPTSYGGATKVQRMQKTHSDDILLILLSTVNNYYVHLRVVLNQVLVHRSSKV